MTSTLHRTVLALGVVSLAAATWSPPAWADAQTDKAEALNKALAFSPSDGALLTYKDVLPPLQWNAERRYTEVCGTDSNDDDQIEDVGLHLSASLAAAVKDEDSLQGYEETIKACAAMSIQGNTLTIWTRGEAIDNAVMLFIAPDGGPAQDAFEDKIGKTSNDWPTYAKANGACSSLGAKCQEHAAQADRVEIDLSTIALANEVMWVAAPVGETVTWAQVSKQGEAYKLSTSRSAGAAGSPMSLKVTTEASTLPSQSDLLNGMAGFLVDRARQELGSWLMKGPLNKLCSTDPNGTLPPTGFLAPKTCETLKGDIIAVVYTRPEQLVSATRKDLIAAPRRTGAWVAATNDDAKVQDQARMLAIGGRLAERAIDGGDPLSTLAGWAARQDQTALWKKVFGQSGGTPTANDLWTTDRQLTTSLYATSVVLNSLPADWAGRRELPDSADESTVNAMLVASVINLKARGLIPDKFHTSTYKAKRDKLREVIAGLTGLKNEATAIAPRLKDASLRLKHALDEGKRALALAAVGEIAGLGSELVGLGLDLGALGPAGLDDNAVNAAKEIIEEAGQLATALATAAYGEAIGHLENLASKMNLGISLEGKVHFPPEISRLLRFSADLAAVQSADDAQAAIEALAAPAGSSQEKRKKGEAAAFIGLNGYVGYGGGWEWQAASDNGFAGGAVALQPDVSLGLEMGGKAKCFIYMGLYLQLLDLGTIASVRLAGDDSDAVTPLEPTFAQTFAPGAMLTFGIPRVPFSLLAGVKFTPLLRADPDTNSPLSDTVQLGASLAIDIPLFP